MLEKPDLPDERIAAALDEAYGICAARVAFLPIGADVNTAVYRVAAEDGNVYFVKLRRGACDEITVSLPLFLHECGVPVIVPVATRGGARWTQCDAYTLIVYPFIEGKDGYEASLTDTQWVAFGAAMRRIHTADPPPALAAAIPREDFAPRCRVRVRQFQAQAETTEYADPGAARLAAFMRQQRGAISRLVDRGDALGRTLAGGAGEMALCHADMHPGNLHITASGAFYIVDWDNPKRAPKEHDLGLIGGDGAGEWTSPRVEVLFYCGYDPGRSPGYDHARSRGYGEAAVDPVALSYYRYERIVLDIAEFCEQLLLSNKGDADREQAYRWMTGQFLPGHEVDIAFKTDRLTL
jgi:spectinomycin phosphotransferase